MGKLPFLFQGIKTSEFIFLPTVCHSRAKTISPVRSKKPMSSYNKVTVIGPAASRVYFHLVAEAARMGGQMV